FPPWDKSHGAPNGIIVLGGEIAATLSREYSRPVVGGEGGRIIAMAELAHAYPNARIVYTGGDASLFGSQPAEADFVYPLLDSLGIPRKNVTLEARSRNT